MSSIARFWRGYSSPERRDIVIYISGIMFYKLGIEFFNGSIVTLASKMFDTKGIVSEGFASEAPDTSIAKPFTKLGGVQGLNQAAQCVGAILIAPLVKRWPTRTVLSAAILMFSLTAAILLIVDVGTDGKFKPKGTSSADEHKFYGHWSPNLLFLLWTMAGICYGMVELIRRVIPVDIVGGHVDKLRSMDATVHIFYEIAGTGGAFASSSAISHWGANKSYLLTPIFFAFAGVTWLFISTLSFSHEQELKQEVEAAGLEVVDRSKKSTNNYFVMVGRGFKAFGESVWLGARLIFTNRCFIWLVPSYAVSLYLHRFLENTLAPAFAKRVLGTVQWSQIIVGGSNLGELLGAFSVLLLSDYVPTPLPWLRFDALALNLVWILPAFARIANHDVSWAWKVAGCFIPISMGWAAGDVSLAAYIQSVLSESTYRNERVSSLGAVMAFLYTTYIVLYAVLSVGLAYVIDQDWQDDKTMNIVQSLKTVGGVQFTICCAIIFASTFIPEGSRSLNPKALGTITTGQTPHESDTEDNGEPKHGPALYL
ncbi:hypothetical protein MD484_g6459, partial [Candolleomyces efflorescens]